jgi:hypothetical protein
MLFNKINLLLLSGSPEVSMSKTLLILNLLNPFGNQKILPECVFISSQLNGVKITYDHISYAIVIEVNLFMGLDLISDISAKTTQLKNYKPLFQDAYGPDHLIPDTTCAGIFLSRELAHQDWPDTLRFQPTGVEHDYIRVNLLLVKNGTIPRDTLLLAMVKSAPLARNPDIEDFRKEWQKVLEYIEKKYPNMPGLASDQQFIEETLSAGDVVIHYSEHYNQTYKRRYRIIHRSVFDAWEVRYF